MSDEEKYQKKLEEVKEKYNDPMINAQIESYLSEIEELLDCAVDLEFMIYPQAEEYQEHLDSGEVEFPKQETVPLKRVVEALQDEDEDYKVFVDPIYLKPGLNPISDVLVTTQNNNVIIVPVRNTKDD
jgi:ABC-type thiamine transport system substrate-binding protein